MSVHIRKVENHLVSFLPYSYERQCDVIFHCANGRAIEAHRLLLASVSPFLKNLFQEKEQASRDSIQVLLPDINADDLDLALRYVYEGLIRMENEEVARFHQVSEVLGLNIPFGDDGKEICENVSPGKQKKRKCGIDSEEVCRKFQKDENNDRREVIQTINTIIQNFSADFGPKRNGKERDVNTIPKPKQKEPLLVPIKHLRTVLSIFEEKKAEKRLEALVHQAVKKQLKKIKESFKKQNQLPKHQVQPGREENQQVLVTSKPASQSSLPIVAPNQSHLSQPASLPVGLTSSASPNHNSLFESLPSLVKFPIASPNQIKESFKKPNQQHKQQLQPGNEENLLVVFKPARQSSFRMASPNHTHQSQPVSQQAGGSSASPSLPLVKESCITPIKVLAGKQTQIQNERREIKLLH